MEIVREEYPECFATTSSSVSPQFREFERFTTTAMNAFVGPKVRNYVTRLESEIEASGFKADLRIMASNGGVATPAMVAERPVLTLLSGPAAGVIGGDWAGGLSGRRNLITFDVGGTSADIGIVTDGGFGEATARDTWIAGFPVLVPMIDVHTIGAGGGSIAYRRPGRRLQGRAALGRRRAGPGRLRPRRHARHRDRRQCRAGPPRRRQLPGRRHVARRGRGAARDRRAGARARPLRPRGGRGRDHRDQRQHGQRHPLAHRPEGHRSAQLRAGGLRRRRPAAWRRSGRDAGRPRGDRAAASRHHLGGRPADQRPALRRHPHLLPGLGRRRPRAHQCRLRRDGEGTGRPLHRRRHRPRQGRPSSAAATCAMSARATSCACPSPTARSTRRRSPRPSRPSTRSTSASTAITSPTPRSRS